MEATKSHGPKRKNRLQSIRRGRMVHLTVENRPTTDPRFSLATFMQLKRVARADGVCMTRWIRERVEEALAARAKAAEK